MSRRIVAWTVLKQGDAYQAVAMTQNTVGGALSSVYEIAEHGDEPAYRLAEAAGAQSGLPFVSSHLPWSRPVATITKAEAAATAAATAPKPTGVTYAASYGTSVIETPAPQPAVMPTSSFAFSPTFGKR